MNKVAEPMEVIVHVVDDDESFHATISRLLRAAGYNVRNHTNVGRFLLTRFDEARGCILLDVRMPGVNGLDLQEALAMRTRTLPIIFLSGYRDVPSTVRAIKAGAIDFLTKPVRRETLLNAIQNALAHDAKERANRELLRHWHTDYETLTPRELEVFSRVVAGKMNKEIAGELKAAERTVKAHRAQVMRKMHASSLAELVHIADQLDTAGIGLRSGVKG
jgi:two-component system, LuxR family, response regulator FixJ